LHASSKTYFMQAETRQQVKTASMYVGSLTSLASVDCGEATEVAGGWTLSSCSFMSRVTQWRDCRNKLAIMWQELYEFPSRTLASDRLKNKSCIYSGFHFPGLLPVSTMVNLKRVHIYTLVIKVLMRRY
jgi:hypothetical protein